MAERGSARAARWAAWIPWAAACTLGLGGAVPRSAVADVVLHGQETSRVEARSRAEQLWLLEDELERVGGFEVKPEGLCLAEICVPVAAERDGDLVSREAGTVLYDLAALARRLDQPYAFDAEMRVWSFGAVPVTRRAFLERAQAPDFALADRAGKRWRLSEQRGKKLVLVVWASWCACRDDLPIWERLHRELAGRGVEIVAIAQDAGGFEAAGPYVDAAATTHTSLVDPTHAVTAAYDLVNVPTAIWIDETGTIVRIDDGAYPEQRRIIGVEVGVAGYADALRDWVARGSASPYARAPEALVGSLRHPSQEAERADQEFRIGSYFHSSGDLDRATEHWERAAELAPDNWNYRRQEWADSGFESTVKFLGRAFGRRLLGVPYYRPIELETDGTAEDVEGD